MSLTSKEQSILDSIYVASDNDPSKPEFPADDPKFPATPTFKIKVPGFSNVWMKSEYYNETGTHKDRMAWEIVVTYRDFLRNKKEKSNTGPLPHMSIISSGSAATAIQTQLQKYQLPNLKVLVDLHTNPEIINSMEKIGCEVFTTDLAAKSLSSREILELTKNKDGLDITSGEALDPATRFYDWLSYEIVNESPEYCFVPFGTGNLYENILNINKRSVSLQNIDPRFFGDVKRLSNCHYLGATTDNPESKAAEKLYSPHLPFVHYDEQWIEFYKTAGYCGEKSDVHVVEEKYIDEAITLAQEQGIIGEPSGLAGLALFLQMKDSIPKDKKVLIVNTGKVKYPK